MKPLGTSDPTVVGPYRLLGVLGSGGMARVYLGQSPTGRRLAIKVVRADLAENPAFRRRFAREVAAARTVSPLFTAAVVDADVEAEAPWLATIYIDGPSLDQLVTEQGPLATEAVLTLAAGLAEALASIHRSGLVHRDLKPSNVILNDTGPHIIDFGVVLLTDATQATTSLVLGTPSYMAPERLDGAEAGPACDIFSLGATLFRAATGKSLVNGGSAYEQVMRITLGRFDFSAVPVELRPLIMRCVSRRPQDRPTAEELVRILVGAGASTPAPGWYRATAARPPTVAVEPSQTSPLSRRRVLALGGVFGATFLGGGGMLVATALFDHGKGGASAASTIATTASSGPGRVLWQVRTGARPLAAPGSVPGLDDADARVIIDHGVRVITADPSQLFAVDVRGRRLWARTLPTTVLDLRQWGDGLLAFDARRLWLLDPGSGQPRWSVDVAGTEEAASHGDHPHDLPAQISAVALSTERAFLNVGTATVAIDRNGRQLWRNPRPAPRDGYRPAPASPHVADARWLVTRDVTDATVEIGLYDAATGNHRWSTRYDLGPQAPPPPVRPGGPPPDNAWHRSEGRMSGPHVALRDAQLVTVLRLSDGSTAWRNAFPRPVVAIEPMGDLLLVSADRLTAYATATGTQAWQVPLRGARIAVSTDGRRVIAATGANISAMDHSGVPQWQAELPEPVRGAQPDRLTTDDRAAFVTFRSRPRGPEPPDIDVVAIALDAGA
jgi:outer membrane protein assembly factor BamB/predicted Ser/Thr protein kinase